MVKLNPFPKVALVILIGAVAYLIMFLVLSPVLAPRPVTMMEMMGSVIGGSGDYIIVNLVSFIFAVFLAFFVSIYLFKFETNESEKEKTGKELTIIKKVLSADEKKVIEEIDNSGEITQDSLRFRLGWSKAKISTILTNLDRIGLIQRERVGKTYKVYLQK